MINLTISDYIAGSIHEKLHLHLLLVLYQDDHSTMFRPF